MKYIVDIETDSLDPTIIWCIVARPVDGGEVSVFTDRGRFGHPPISEFYYFAEGITQYIGHNLVAFDVPALNKLTGTSLCIDNTFPNVVDTFVVSRLVQFKSYGTHSLEEIGASLGEPKGDFSDFSQLTEEMVEYCIQDTAVNLKVYNRLKRYIDDPKWADSMWCEHEMHKICREMRTNGFYFNGTLANRRLEEIEQHISSLEEEMARFEPFTREVARLKYRVKANGELYQTVTNAYNNYDICKLEGDTLVCYNRVPFNPGSTKDRVEKLWEFGWQPVERTDTAYRFQLKGRPNKMWGKTYLTEELYNEKKKYFDYYGYTVNEGNLQTLPADAPEGARCLAQWLTLDGRRKALRERLDNLEQDFRIRTNFWHIGSWTHRMAHSSPNLANISSPFHGEAVSPVDEIKFQYDADMRRMFSVESGYLVGTDAESIQLRILAHYLKNDDYVHAILSGVKADETDIHNVNRRALGLDWLTRDHAKTFIYAWLLGAGTAKVARILDCTMTQAKKAVNDFIENTEGLASLKKGLIQRDASRGYFDGLDGRKVMCNDAYLMLAGYLQNGETVVMKHANIRWLEKAREAKINFKQVNFVHDEWQTQVYGSLDAAEYLGQLQCEALEWAGHKLGCYCPMAGETRIGQDWLETH